MSIGRKIVVPEAPPVGAANCMASDSSGSSPRQIVGVPESGSQSVPGKIEAERQSKDAGSEKSPSMNGQYDNRPPKLRVIRTARTLDGINDAAKVGFRPLVKPVEPSPEIRAWGAVYQHRDTGEIEVYSGGGHWQQGEGYDEVLRFRDYYPYSFPEPFAAYLLPPNLDEGERVWLEDIIEDIVAAFTPWGAQRLTSGEAIWTLGEFKIQFDPKKNARMIVG